MEEITLEQQMINAWKDEYIQDGKCTIEFSGYEELAMTDGFRMGLCIVYFLTPDNTIIAKIYLDDDHDKCPTFFRDAVLWHEFCHAWDAIENHHADHCTGFQKKKFKKPLYAIADIILKLIGWRWFD